MNVEMNNYITGELKTYDRPLSIGVLLVFGGIALVFAYANFVMGMGLYTLIAIAGLIVIWLMIKFPLFWIFSSAAISEGFLRGSQYGITVMDVVYGVMYVLANIVWIVWMLGVKKEKLIKNSGDLFMLFFYIVLIFNFFIGVLRGTPPDIWLREYGLFSIILLYFPIRHYIRTNEQVKWFLIILALSVCVSAFVQLNSYRHQTLATAIYAYELGGSIRLDQTLFTSAVMFGIAFMIGLKNKWQQFVILAFSFLSLAALVVSFSRTYWVFLAGAVVLILFFVPFREKIKFILTMLIISVLFAGVVTVVFKEQETFFFKMIQRRFDSSFLLRKDPSLKSRFYEWTEAGKIIKEFPWGGSGLAKEFTFFEPNNLSSITASNIHNGYLFLIFKVGYPHAIIFFIGLALYTYKSFRCIYIAQDTFERSMILGSFTTLILVFFTSLTSAQFFYRDAMIVEAVSLAFVSIVEERFKKRIGSAEQAVEIQVQT